MALRADERRDKLRKASGSGKYTLIRRSLNGETWLSKPQSSYGEYIAMRREPGELKHLSSRRKRKQHVISKVAASEMERGQTGVRACRGSDRGIDSVSLMLSMRNFLMDSALMPRQFWRNVRLNCVN